MAGLAGGALLDQDAGDLSTPDEDIVGPFDRGHLTGRFANELGDGDSGPGGEDNGPAQVGRGKEQNRQQDATVRGSGPGSTILAAAGRLTAGEDRQSIVFWTFGDGEGMGVGACECIEDVDIAAKMARGEVPDVSGRGRSTRGLEEAMERKELPLHGRGTGANPTNRFEMIAYERDDDEPLGPGPRTVFYKDTARTIIATNDSPDVGFDASINPYRGCEHGCIYCYARPFHEYLGLSAGLDFESKIFVKEEAPRLLRKELLARKWKPQTLAISGVTDCYQPIERRLQLTRRCLEVLVEFRNPVGVITKNHLVALDSDLLAELARHDLASVRISVTTLDPELARVMEPRASSPAARFQAIRELDAAGVPVGVMVAPVIPGLTDHEIPAILKAVREAGAREANYVMLRLPHAVKELFADWLRQHFPSRVEKVLGRLRDIRGGKLYDSRFGERLSGSGPLAELVEQVFQTSYRRLGFPGMPEKSTAAFRRPSETPRALFESV